MMFHKFRITFVFLALILLGGCIGSDPNGFPHHITLNSTGSTLVLVGTERVRGISLQDREYQNERDKDVKFENDTIFYRYKWLTAVAPFAEKRILLFATTNDTGKKREMWIDCDFGSDLHTIHVTQLAR